MHPSSPAATQDGRPPANNVAAPCPQEPAYPTSHVGNPMISTAKRIKTNAATASADLAQQFPSQNAEFTPMSHCYMLENLPKINRQPRD
jgi:hypothetical protein